MSAFLGPIHYWLYNKIRLQQSIVDELYLLGSQTGLSLQEECEDQYGEFENKPLEEMIDQGNIHGWLQERVSQVEYKYAYCVTSLLRKDASILETLKSILFSKGKELGKSLTSSDITATGLFKVITDNLLDGMPCDHANRLIDQSETEVVWTRTLCVHSSYWEEIGGDVAVYYELRDSWIEGLTKEPGFTFDKVDAATYRIRLE
jgi:hypothetical protein